MKRAFAVGLQMVMLSDRQTEPRDAFWNQRGDREKALDPSEQRSSERNKDHSANPTTTTWVMSQLDRGSGGRTKLRGREKTE